MRSVPPGPACTNVSRLAGGSDETQGHGDKNRVSHFEYAELKTRVHLTLRGAILRAGPLVTEFGVTPTPCRALCETCAPCHLRMRGCPYRSQMVEAFYLPHPVCPSVCVYACLVELYF
ncbi:hypothetical protein E2C01_074994 [Portunus trituberculatus]|uniref:Uncharacterized protein n=1 Tax=Portunus trituberculatus TaxID=210409 RepID=A0A5B7IDV0_PORTR|nr:hypothetical protein [Portunus trituberculatus]